uniref:Uncharacterized protein n=1 Tax=Rhizophora mucronata TaxID=61149 RepID=A0A2P2PCF7_RHIMU
MLRVYSPTLITYKKLVELIMSMDFTIYGCEF